MNEGSFQPLNEIGKGKRKRRLLINGEPLTWKTASLLTTPAVRHIVSMPGEKGYDTLPTNDPDTKTYIYEYDPSDPKKLPSYQVVKLVRETVVKIIAGGFGPCETICLDGIHKFHEFILDKAAGGDYFSGATREERQKDGSVKTVSAVEGIHYGIAEKEFYEFIGLVMNSSVPVAVFTCWSGPEKERKAKPGERERDIPTNIWPDLPGRLSKRILGEFSVIAGSLLMRPKPGESPRGFWQLVPDEDIRGVGLHVEPRLAKTVPRYIPADYRVLEKILAGPSNNTA